MDTILITGATGNVGIEVLRQLAEAARPTRVLAGTRDPDKDSEALKRLHAEATAFDFAEPKSYASLLKECRVVFLLRPPQISNAAKYFQPFVQQARAANVQHIVFLSVQGVQNSRLIPHHKIEQLIARSGIDYTFLRPAYFMQNFLTTLHRDLVDKRRIFLPAGNARFTLIDLRDLGRVAAAVLTDPVSHRNRAYDITNGEKLTFAEMANTLSSITGVPVTFESPALLRFFVTKTREGYPPMLTLVMIMLHYLPRFQQEPPTSEWVKQITGREPASFATFVQDYQAQLRSQ